MACTIPSDILTQYPKQVALLLYSTPEVGEISDGGISNDVVGYLDALEKIAQSSATVPSAERVENPYGTRLRLLSSLQGTNNMKDVYIETITFTVYDHSVTGSTVAQTDTETYQDATLNSAVDSSQSSVSDKYLTSPFRNAMVGNWQPNWFRPLVRIAGKTIFSTIDTFYGNGDHLGDKSIGFDFPFCVDVYASVPDVKDIEIYAMALMYIASGGDRNFKRFGVKAEIKLRTR